MKGDIEMICDKCGKVHPGDRPCEFHQEHYSKDLPMSLESENAMLKARIGKLQEELDSYKNACIFTSTAGDELPPVMLQEYEHVCGICGSVLGDPPPGYNPSTGINLYCWTCGFCPNTTVLRSKEK
jgi:hypothetical protein